MNIVRRVLDLVGSPLRPQVASSAAAEVPLTAESYEEVAASYYSYLPDDVRDIFINDAVYHKDRYLEMVHRTYGPQVLELGSDKPFISHFLRVMHPHAAFETVSIDIPFSKYPITRVDIESEVLPFATEFFSDVIFTEVLEHLFRDPAWTLFQINRVMTIGGTLFLTTPNACGYDSLINLVNQLNPNARSQFFASIESGHPHLWTATECLDMLTAHGFELELLDSVDYVPIPRPPELMAFLQAYSRDREMHGQSLRVVARKVRTVNGPSYPLSLFPDGKPVQLQGALREWALNTLAAETRGSIAPSADDPVPRTK